MSPVDLQRAVEAAILPMRASFGAWGLVGGSYVPEDPAGPVLRLRTTTEIQRVELQAQVWMQPQIHMLLLRLGLTAEEIARVRLEFDSLERPVGAERTI